MKKKIEAVIFDMNGVLQLGEGKSIHNFARKKFKTNVDEYLDAIDTSYAKSITGEISAKEVIKTFSTNLKKMPKEIRSIYKKAFKKKFKRNKQLFKRAFELKKQGYKIAILSDQWPLSKIALMPEKYTKRFDEVVVSCDVKVRKPDPKIYKLILKKLKLKAQSCVFIDNRKWNLIPAKKLGMKTILFENNKKTLEELEKLLPKNI